jgi:ribosomal protein L30
MPKTSASMKAEKPKVLRITLVKSPIGYSVTHKATIKALGLRRMHQTVEQGIYDETARS